MKKTHKETTSNTTKIKEPAAFLFFIHSSFKFLPDSLIPFQSLMNVISTRHVPAPSPSFPHTVCATRYGSSRKATQQWARILNLFDLTLKIRANTRIQDKIKPVLWNWQPRFLGHLYKSAGRGGHHSSFSSYTMLFVSPALT